jgi:uncharacterized protein (UPF0335 family)
MADNKVIPFKKDPDFAVHNEAAVAPIREVLCTLISNLESLEMERADIVREISDNLVIARAKGFNIGAIRKILAERRRDKGELEEERAVIELYKSFLGMYILGLLTFIIRIRPPRRARLVVWLALGVTRRPTRR